MNFENISQGIFDHTGYYINEKDLEFIFKAHDIKAPGDIKKIWMNLREFDLNPDLFPLILGAMIKYPAQNFQSVKYSMFECKYQLVKSIRELPKHLNILVCGSWHGLTTLLLKSRGFTNIHCIDIDKEACGVAEILGVHTDAKDMFDVNFDEYDIIINSSCEHINFKKWLKLLPHGKTVVLQSTNMPWKNHINIVESTTQFAEIVEDNITLNQALYDIEFTGPLPEMKKYKRFTLIGTVR